MNNRFAVLINELKSPRLFFKKIRPQVHPYARYVYESVNKSGYLCEYIGLADLEAGDLNKYKGVFLLNAGRLADRHESLLKDYLKNGGNLILTFKNPLAKEFGISFYKDSYQDYILLNKEKINYSIKDADNLFYKISKRYLKNAFPFEEKFKLPVKIAKPSKDNEVLATWSNTGFPALLVNKSNNGLVVYFSGILAGAESFLLKYILSFIIGSSDFEGVSAIPNNKKCCVAIFHDYEREYGNPKFGRHADRGLDSILDIEAKYNIKATYNIVGKICLSHPETIRRIIQAGHEIACHTYGHEVPGKVNYKKLTESLELSLTTFKNTFNIELKGFRSPESKWSAALIEILEKNNFCWNAEDEDACLPYNLISGRKPNIVRIPVIFDDFSYISGNTTPQEMLCKLKGIIVNGIKKRGFIAIGFHPWIQGMDEQRIKVFEEFISYLISNNEITIMALGEVCEWWNKRLAK